MPSECVAGSEATRFSRNESAYPSGYAEKTRLKRKKSHLKVKLQVFENQKYKTVEVFFFEKKTPKKHFFLAYFQIRL